MEAPGRLGGDPRPPKTSKYHTPDTTPCVARTMRGAGHGEAVSREHDPIGLEDTGEEHVLPQHAFSSAPAAPGQG
jgi:hypothetical protein